MKLKYIIKDLMFLRTYNSPFKPLKLKWYFGKIAKGTPYFLPRTWKKATPEKAYIVALEEIEKVKKHNSTKENYKLIERPFDELYESYLNYSFAEPKIIGFDFVSLGWKTKYDDYRFEYSPIWSFVFFGYQICLTFVAPHLDHYWEAFLAYYYETDKTKSKVERIEDCRKRFPQTWTTHFGDKKETLDYYELILKKSMQLEDNLRQNLLGQLSDEKTEVDVTIASGIARKFALNFYSFLAKNYHTEDESWSYSKLPSGFVQNRKTYDIIEITEALKIFEDEPER